MLRPPELSTFRLNKSEEKSNKYSTTPTDQLRLINLSNCKTRLRRKRSGTSATISSSGSSCTAGSALSWQSSPFSPNVTALHGAETTAKPVQTSTVNPQGKNHSSRRHLVWMQTGEREKDYTQFIDSHITIGFETEAAGGKKAERVHNYRSAVNEPQPHTWRWTLTTRIRLN